ncbi:glutamate mutase L [Candidatus Bathyarchaeota archaeon]|nr:glutamate mutase L [Candidatus Bathyarchaeota archaeon]
MSQNKPQKDLLYALVTDVGSTTTKARLFHKTKDEWRFLVAGEAPTTVETPYEDVTLGVINAVKEVEELTGKKILKPDGSGIETPFNGKSGVDIYCTTSSAGGGLQMMVAGLISSMTAESANRAALGAGAIVMDVMAEDDGREPFEKIKQIRSLRPDMILLAGGTDGGAIEQVISIAELIKASEPKARLGASYALPFVYAGNKDLHNTIQNMMEKSFALIIVDNIRPVLEMENTEPARRAIHELFMEHVMSHAPGYKKLMQWTDIDIMPTPAGEGLAMQLIANTYKQNSLGVGLGGATTNVYSIVDGRFVRSVSANLGMSYSICNVLKEATIENIMRWLPFDIDPDYLGSQLSNKMIRPTTIPQTLKDLMTEHSVAREALRLGFNHHKSIATRLKGVSVLRTVSDMFTQELAETYIDMMKMDILAGTGGLLSHAPRRIQSMLILTDAFQPEGITKLYQDSVFMMPHLGVFSTVHQQAAWEIFDKDCLLRLGTVIAPKGTAQEGNEVMSVDLEMPDGTEIEETVKFGDLKLIPLATGSEARVTVTPGKGFNMGAEKPEAPVRGRVMGGEAGIILDGRGRPLWIPSDNNKRKELLLKWFKTLELYSKDVLETF